MSDTVNIRAIQHYMYCPRRFALLEINDDWAENAFVVKADIMHENVHSGKHSFSSSEAVVRSSVSIYNDDYDIFGVADCIELIPDKNGCAVSGLDGLYRVKIIEYKPRPPKEGLFHESDAIQVFAQKLCADYLWHCDSECYIYYSETRKRVKLPFDTEAAKYRQMLEKYLGEMRELLSTGEIPPKKKERKCTGCSISDVCFSKQTAYSVRDDIMSMKGEE